MIEPTTFPTRPIGTNGLCVPVLGFGTAPLGGMYKAVDDMEGGKVLAAALAAGMTYIDTAPFYGYGLSERRVGDGLRAFRLNPGCEGVISTKVGRLLVPGAADQSAAQDWPAALPFHPVYDYSYDGIMRSFEHSLQRLGLDRVDILYVHDIGEITHGASNAHHFGDLERNGYRALDDLRSSGAVKAIGLGVNEANACLDALEIGDWDVFLLAGRYTLLEQDPIEDLLPRCVANGTSVVIGGPFNSGLLVGGETWNYAVAPPDVRARVQRLEGVCQAFDVPLPAAALQFPLAHKAVSSVIPGLRSQAELAETLKWASTPIPVELWDALRDAQLLHPDAPTPLEQGSPFQSDTAS